MRAVLLHRHGPPDVLRVEDVPDPSPGPGEVAVTVEAIGLNFAEVQSRKGVYGWVPERPYILGMEAAGVIDALGSGVDGRRVGEAVLVGSQYGSYAERIVVDADSARPAIAGFTIEEGAAFGVNYITAWVSLMEMARLRPSDRVLVTAAAGGVGTAAVQIADKFGCQVVALAGSDAKLEVARGLGADIGVRYGDAGFPDRLRDALGAAGVDVVLETVGGEVFRACDGVLAPFGRMVVAGYAGLDYKRWNPLSLWRAWRDMPRMPLGSMLRGSKGMLSTHLGYLLPDPERLLAVWSELTGFVAEHAIRPKVGHVLRLDDVAEAHRLMESRESIGKIVMRV